MSATAKVPHHVGRLVNHSKARSNLRLQELYMEGEPGLYFTALRDIQAGVELLWDCAINVGFKDLYARKHKHIAQCQVANAYSSKTTITIKDSKIKDS